MSIGEFQIFQLLLALRVVAAGICGAVIGLERLNRSKSAGIRTHCIVAVGAALMMVISKYGFSDTSAGEFGMRGADGARIAAQVVSGIGFLGAGMIFVHKSSITGLTTAAGIWATAGIGMAIGAGMYVLGAAATLIVVASQILLHRNFKWLQASKSRRLLVDGVDEEDYQIRIKACLARMGISVTDVAVERGEDQRRNYRFTLELPDSVSEDDVIGQISYPCRIKSAS